MALAEALRLGPAGFGLGDLLAPGGEAFGDGALVAALGGLVEAGVGEGLGEGSFWHALSLSHSGLGRGSGVFRSGVVEGP